MPLRVLQRMNRQGTKPIYWQVKEMLKANIERGNLKPGEVLPGRLELCRLLGASRPAVDHAIAELVKEGWLVSIKGKGTFVADRTTDYLTTITVVWSHSVTTQDNIYWGPLFRGISYAAGELKVRLLFQQCSPTAFLGLLKETKADGLLVLAPHIDDEVVLHDLRRKRCPFVAVSSYFKDETLPCVGIDNFAGVRKALEHLWGLGHMKIGMVNLALQSTDLLRRWEAFQSLMGERGLPLDLRWVVLSTAYRWGEVDIWVEEMERWVRSVPLPTAILTAAYDMALIVLKALKQQGISVPQEVSLVSFDDPASAAFLEPPLTTVRQPLETLGRRSVQKLYDALREEVMPEGTELLPPELVVRSSTAPPKGGQNPPTNSKGGVL